MNLNATLFVQTAVLIVLGWATMKFIWPPLIAAIDARQKKIAEGLAAADKSEKSLVEARQTAQEIVKEARDQAGKIVEQANRRSTEVIDEAKVTASAEGQRLLTDARSQASLESTRARQQLRQEVGALAVAAASKLIGREIDAKTHAALLDSLASEIERG